MEIGRMRFDKKKKKMFVVKESAIIYNKNKYGESYKKKERKKE